MVDVERIDDRGDDAGLAQRLGGPADLAEDVAADEEVAVVEQVHLPLPAARQVGVDDVEVLEALDRLEGGQHPLVAQVVGEADVGLGDEGLVVGDADRAAGVLDEQLEAAVLVLAALVDRHLDGRLEARQLVGPHRLDVGLGGVGDQDRLGDRLLDVQPVEVEAALPVGGVDQLLGAVGPRQHRRLRAAGDRVGVAGDAARRELQAVDVVGARAVRGEVDPLAVGRVDGVGLVGLALGELEALARVVAVDPEQLGVAADDRAEDQRLAVRRVGRRLVVDAVAGDVADLAARQLQLEDVEAAVTVPGEGDAAAVGTPRQARLLLDLDLDGAGDAALEDVDQHQIAPSPLAGEEGQAVAVGREGQIVAAAPGHGQVLDHEVLVVGRPALGQVAQQLALAGVEQHHVDVALGGREGRHQVARGRGRGRQGGGAATAGGAEGAAEVGRLAGLDQLRQVALAQPAAELAVEVLGVHAEGALDRAADPRADGVAHLDQEVAQRLLAPLLLDEVEHRVAEAVGEEAADVGLGDRRDAVVDHRVAQVHPVARRLVLGHVAGHALHEPGGRRRGDALAGAALAEDVVLEDVGQLVEDQLHQLGVGQVHRQHHPVAHRRGEGADALGDEVEDDVVLLERRVGLVEDQRRRLLDLVVELLRQVVVGALGERHHLLQQVRLLLVVVDVEMGRVVDLPVEVPVLDLVLAELRRGPGGQQQTDGGGDG